MRNVEMAVVISDTNADEERFTKQGLDISKHKAKMAEISPEGLDLEDRFKTPHDPLSLVFVCAMWLTGFDVKNLSTLYLDKPMKSHTLMQAIARANRVYPGKPCGIIVDYVNVFKYMKQALSDYGSGNDDDDYPAKDIESLKTMIDDSVKEGEEFLSSIGIDLNEMMAEKGTFNKSSAILNAYNTIIATDDGKEKFKVITNTMCNLYEASKPEIFEQHWRNPKFAPLKYIHDLFDNSIRDDRVEEAKQRISDVLDGSISSSDVEENSDIVIHEGKVIDLSKLDVDDLKKEIKHAPYKAIEINDLKEYLEKALEQMINKNVERVKFSERFKGIVDRYNSGSSENEDYYDQLLQLIEDLKKESTRANFEGLTEEELELFDLLIKDKKLTKAEEQSVKLAAKSIYSKLTEEKSDLFVVDWYKDEQPKLKVKQVIEQVLDEGLPDCYDKEIFAVKTNLLLNHFVDMTVQHYGWVCA